ncbi:MAG: type II toxin-antitoxin system PemK/MazF family toxin [Candidatus Sedimenticola sp. (ex Thyasira tokunagai)]
MPLTYHPKPGTILMCDFSEGFKEPEMVKNRPVIVISPKLKRRGNLATVVCISTSKPPTMEPYHCEIPRVMLPNTGFFQGKPSWVKGDMVYTVGFHRLNLVKLKTKCPRTGKRLYDTRLLGPEKMKEVYSCVLCAMNLNHLTKHI